MSQTFEERNAHLFNDESFKRLAENALDIYEKEYLTISKTFNAHSAVASIHMAMDGEIAWCREQQTFSCKRGCSHCCHQKVEIYEDEAKYIGEMCQEKGIPISKKHLKKQNKTPYTELIRNGHSACVFLKNNECSIYEFRPLICRAHTVASPPELCIIHTGSKEIKSLMTFVMAALLQAPRITGQKLARMTKLLLPYSK